MPHASFAQTIHLIAVLAIPLLFAITLHEAAHGWIASKLGDNTALMLGRVTANPIKHIDLVGTIIVPILIASISPFIFGWAKPVPVNWTNLKRPKRDMALVAIAGPASNLLMAIGWALIAKICFSLLGGAVSLNPNTSQSIIGTVFLSAYFGIVINLVLMVLNLIPIPPLDGSRVVASFLSPPLSIWYEKIEPYGFFILIGLLFLGQLKLILIQPVMSLLNVMTYIFGLPAMS